MIENAKSQIALVLILVAASLASLYLKRLKFGLDLAGGTELIYSVDLKDVPKDADIDEFMRTTVSTIRSRIDPDGILESQVLRRGNDGIYVALPGMNAQQAEEVEDKITRLGTLQMQLVAYDDYTDASGKKVFELDKERDRLKKWIEKDNNKETLLKDPLSISRYHQLDIEQGGPLVGPDKLRWVPHKIEGRIKTGGVRGDDRDYSYTNASKVGPYVVTLFDPKDLQTKVTKDKPYLLEYLPINFRIQGFTGEDLIADRVHPSVDQNGNQVVIYEFQPDRADDHYKVSEENVGKMSAIIMDGYLKSAPTFEEAIGARGQIRGFTQPEALALSEVLKRGSLKVKPVQQSKVTIGPTLGKASIYRGAMSLVIGSVLVLLFMLFYYRIAGIVATVGILLNVGFVFGAVSFIGATLTLPGLGGLVLTIGMAVDANILIYERIREEMRHGSDLAISVRHGFERAMVTIIDANLTTFIAGLVLFQFGSGPIRGFAVTLMIGIITSLFTAFFISRLIFHFLLERKIQSLSMASWFGRMRMNFLKFTKPAFALSAAVILGGLWVFFDTPSDIKNSLDFTGGADVRVVTAEEMTAQDLKKLLVDPSRAANAEFRKDFPDAQVNTVESTSESGKARKFSVKLKVSPELAAAIAKETEKDPLYRPPYVTKLQTALEGTLVPQAFTGARVTTEKGRRTNLAEIVVHNTEPLETSAMVAAVRKAMQNNSAEVVVTALANGKPDKALTKAKDLRVEFDVPKSVEDSKGLVSYVSSLLQPKAAHQQPDSAAKPEGPAIVLSNPIPDVAVIGGRMVGELKSAAIGAMLVALICIVLYIRLRFHQYKYGIAAVVALVHDVLVALGLVVLFNRLGLVYAELSLSMIAAFLTIIGYSINDTIVIFDRVRENLANQLKAGDTTRSFADTINLSINQTLSRTILTSGTTFFVVLALLFVNYGSGSELEGFAFAMIIGIITGTYSTIFIASPIVMWLRSRETHDAGLSEDGGLAELADQDEAVPAVAH